MGEEQEARVWCVRRPWNCDERALNGAYHQNHEGEGQYIGHRAGEGFDDQRAQGSVLQSIQAALTTLDMLEEAM